MKTINLTNGAVWSEGHDPRALLISAVVIGGVFFFLHHHPDISTVENYAPWAVTTSTFASEGTETRGVVYGMVAVLGTWFLVRHRGRVRLQGLVSLLVVAFIGWACLSLTWSHDVRVTAVRLAVLLLTCIGAFGVSRALTPADLMRLTILITLVYLSIGLAAELALRSFKPWAAGYRFAGTLHPNAQGGNLALLSLAAYSQLRWKRSRNRIWASVLALGLGFLLLTRSRTACGALLVALVFLEWVARPPLQRMLVTFAACLVAGLVLFVIGVVAADPGDDLADVALLGRAEDAEGLNGRQPVWEALRPFIEARFWAGYGYESFWTQSHIESVQSAVRWQVRDAHSAYLNMILGVGLIGALLFVAMLISALQRAWVDFSSHPTPGGAFFVGMIVHFLASGLLEANASPPGLEILLLCASVAHLVFPPEWIVAVTWQPSAIPLMLAVPSAGEGDS